MFAILSLLYFLIVGLSKPLVELSFHIPRNAVMIAMIATGFASIPTRASARRLQLVSWLKSTPEAENINANVDSQKYGFLSLSFIWVHLAFNISYYNTNYSANTQLCRFIVVPVSDVRIDNVGYIQLYKLKVGLHEGVE